MQQSATEQQKQAAIIRSFIQAEDNRVSLVLGSLLADTLHAYWNMEIPARQKILERYKDYWTKNRYSKNTVLSVTNIAANTYRVHTSFEVQRITADTAIRVESNIIYQLNKAGKIVFVGKEEGR